MPFSQDPGTTTMNQQAIWAAQLILNPQRQHTIVAMSADKVMVIEQRGRGQSTGHEVTEPQLLHALLFELKQRPQQTRKIIQTSAIPADNDHAPCIIALCDDGTLWEMTVDAEPHFCTWRAVPATPQEKGATTP